MNHFGGVANHQRGSKKNEFGINLSLLHFIFYSSPPCRWGLNCIVVSLYISAMQQTMDSTLFSHFWHFIFDLFPFSWGCATIWALKAMGVIINLSSLNNYWFDTNTILTIFTWHPFPSPPLKMHINITRRHQINCLRKKKLESKYSKYKIYSSMFRPIITCIWNMNVENSSKKKKRMLVFEREILRKIIGPKEPNGQWRIKAKERNIPAN